MGQFLCQFLQKPLLEYVTEGGGLSDTIRLLTTFLSQVGIPFTEIVYMS